MSILIIGPNEPLHSGEPSNLHVDPRQGKEAVAVALRKLECDAFTLDGKPRVDGETRIRRFVRILEQNHVQTVLVVWPNGTTLRENDVEISHLLTRIVEGKLPPEQVIVLAESDCEPLAHDEGEPVLSFEDEGPRALYYRDLVDEGCQVRRWFDLESLGYVVSSIAIEQRRFRKTKAVADVVTMINPKLPADAAGIS